MSDPRFPGGRSEPFYNPNEQELADLRAELKLMERKVITCGVAATNPDANLTLRADYMQWDSPQAAAVRALRKERDDLRASVAHAAAQLEAAEAKDGDAPESARAHFREAVRTIARTLPTSDVKFDRTAVWGELREMDRLHAELQQREDAIQKLCAEMLRSHKNATEHMNDPRGPNEPTFWMTVYGETLGSIMRMMRLGLWRGTDQIDGFVRIS